MNCIIPFTKDIKFKTNISEILSISLEHDYTLNDSELLGNFIITGDYKSHEVSVNKERFEHVLPFSVALTDRIDADTLEFNIEDFTYEVLNNNTLKIDIEYSVRGDTIEEERDDKIVFEKLESEEEKTVEELLDEMEEKLDKLEEKKQEEKEEIIEEALEEVPDEEVREEVEIIETKDEVEESVVVENMNEERPLVEAQVQEEKEVEEMVVERDMTEMQKETILNSINTEDDNAFVTYHIHVLKENETVETVCSLYSTSSNLLAEYNDLANMSIGDKIIIPEENE